MTKLKEVLATGIKQSKWSFPYNNIKRWCIEDLYDNRDTDKKDDEDKRDDQVMIGDGLYEGTENIHSLVIKRLTSAKIWMNEKLQIPQCKLLKIEGINWKSLQSLLRIFELLKEFNFCLYFTYITMAA